MKHSLIISALALALMASCATKPKAIGGDKDKHGCYIAAGYTWSEALKDCIQPWEKGICLRDAADAAATSAAYAVFTPDSSRVELFLPSISKRPMLSRAATGWADRSFSLKTEQGLLRLYFNGRLIYKQETSPSAPAPVPTETAAPPAE